MNIIVPIKMVPDLVEELSIDPSGAALDTAWLRLILNEFDDHAIEQAILLKERLGGQVTVIAPDAPDVDDALFTAAAKGADRLIKLTGDTELLNSHAIARAMAAIIKAEVPDLILTGVQAHNDLDGQVGPLLAENLSMPYVGYVSAVKVENKMATVKKEYPGGLLAEFMFELPAVLGIQASDEPPRYVAFSKVRQAMQTGKIEEQDFGVLDVSGGATVSRMFQPEVGERAEMLAGDAGEVAARLVEIMREHGVL
ncbi:MAG: electron transfer flavoprotein subunit beta/FixA family protein [Anaerolineales bacterium]|nr:electron transfer flavoprotein subunit beta/FixA family protein [Anaerolineales bacterium]